MTLKFMDDSSSSGFGLNTSPLTHARLILEACVAPAVVLSESAAMPAV